MSNSMALHGFFFVLTVYESMASQETEGLDNDTKTLAYAFPNAGVAQVEPDAALNPAGRPRAQNTLSLVIGRQQ